MILLCFIVPVTGILLSMAEKRDDSEEEGEILDFGKSRFRGRDSLSADLERALAQLIVLMKKNW